MNNQQQTVDDLRIELRRYPNRRYYDCRRSQHLTLEDIYRLIQGGYNVTVADSKTGEDITARVLAQLLLEHDPLKLAAFPAELLHQIIRSNESLLRDFVETYFNRALTAFLKSQKEFDQYLGQTMGLYGLPSAGRGWTEMMMGPFMRTLSSNDGHATAAEASTQQPPSDDKDLRQTMNDMKQQLAALEKKIEEH